MTILSDKLAALATTDATVAASLAATDAVSVVDGKTVVDVARVDSKVLAFAKADVHAKLEIPKPFTYRGITITITKLEVVGKALLAVTLKADCPTEDMPYLFQNPPLAVVDPGHEAEDLVKREAPDEALREMVGGTVHLIATQLGWKPREEDVDRG
jgi:hypothetical protein